jgi:hypothetical protein
LTLAKHDYGFFFFFFGNFGLSFGGKMRCDEYKGGESAWTDEATPGQRKTAAFFNGGEVGPILQPPSPRPIRKLCGDEEAAHDSKSVVQRELNELIRQAAEPSATPLLA